MLATARTGAAVQGGRQRAVTRRKRFAFFSHTGQSGLDLPQTLTPVWTFRWAKIVTCPPYNVKFATPQLGPGEVPLGARVGVIVAVKASLRRIARRWLIDRNYGYQHGGTPDGG